MKRSTQFARLTIPLLLLLLTLFSCAGLPELMVVYRLPPEADDARGKRVFLHVLDIRNEKDILAGNARMEFGSIAGTVGFSLARGAEQGFKVGLFELPVLFREAFKAKLENLGGALVSEGEKDAINLVIAIKQFRLDFLNHKWIFTMAYEARIMSGEEIVAKQSITGQGERLKLIGRKQADELTSEVFTDAVNRLNLRELLESARR